MKKILLPVMLGLLCSPLCAAEPPLHELVRDLGYADEFITSNLPEAKSKKKQDSAGKAAKASKPSHITPQREALSPDDLLQPRVYQKGESSGMIPVLMRYHRANPTSDRITRKLAVTCLKNGQHREALYWYTQTYQRDRSDFQSLWNMAALSYSLGESRQTQKYLQEYAKVDPNSAWGRMAREFLAGRFSGNDLSQGFQQQSARVGESSGKKTAAPETGDGILVVEGKRYNLESFVNFYDEQIDVEKPTKLDDTLKGKSEASSSENRAEKKPLPERKVIAEKVALPAEKTAVAAFEEAPPGAAAPVATTTASPPPPGVK